MPQTQDMEPILRTSLKRARCSIFSLVVYGAASHIFFLPEASAAESEAPITAEDARASLKGEFVDLAELQVSSEPYELACSSDGALTASLTVPTLAAPTAQQLEDFKLLQAEAKKYQRDAQDFSDRLTSIVRHHYEDRKRRVLAAIDQDVRKERYTVSQARDEAILRLERFVATYSGALADAQATPDAMFRLAALYEERGRADPNLFASEYLGPAIELYLQAAIEFPTYTERASVLYYLGHALNDSGRLNEAQQAWRSLVCANQFNVGILKDSDEQLEIDEVDVEALRQDHSPEFWSNWEMNNPDPIDQVDENINFSSPGIIKEELRFRDPYNGCRAHAQKVEAGAEPKYLAEIWWQIGDYHFGRLDNFAGPYALNRAASAYERSLEYKKPPLYGVAMYKKAWTHYKQQRYRSAVETFVQLLHYADEQERLTGDPGADFRSEAFTYIAGSLAYVDFAGPRAQDPYVARSDALDEPDPLIAEQKMAVAIDRVQDSALIPQDQPWTSSIYKALAIEFDEVEQFHNAIRLRELVVRRFPLDRDGPLLLFKVSETYTQLAAEAPDGSEASIEYARKALAAKTQLIDFVGVTPWTQANKDDIEALARAEELATIGLEAAAVDHTNYARQHAARAQELSDPDERAAELELAIIEFRLASEAWSAFVGQDPNAATAYESRYWLADAYYWIAVLQIATGRVPTVAEIELARSAAIAVRDSNQGDTYRQQAGFYVVKLADNVLAAQARAYQESGGQEGIPQKTSATIDDSQGTAMVLKEALPLKVQDAICARDDYNIRIPLESDPAQNGVGYIFRTAQYFFAYGQFAEARRRLAPLYQQYCGTEVVGFNAWKLLLTMAALEGDTVGSRLLTESKSCALDAETLAQEEALRSPVRMEVAYLEAENLFEKAMQMQDGEPRDATWRAAAAAYSVALTAAPEQANAPSAAINGAYAYQQVGEYDRAIAMYQLFIARYGEEDILRQVRGTDPEEYQRRIQYLAQAYNALAKAYVLFFDFAKAAETYSLIAKNDQFAENMRKAAGRIALEFYSNLNDVQGMQRARAQYARLGASAEELAVADYVIASSKLKRWDADSPDEGANRSARIAAQKSLEAFYNDYLRSVSASAPVVKAAYQMAVLKGSADSPAEDNWLKRTVAAYDNWVQRDASAKQSPEADLAFEAEFMLIDKELKKNFDYDTGHLRFDGYVLDIAPKIKEANVEGEKYIERLSALKSKYFLSSSSARRLKSVAVVFARIASIPDSLRKGLTQSSIQALDDEFESDLMLVEESGNQELIDQYYAAQNDAEATLETLRGNYASSWEPVIVRNYVNAISRAWAFNLSDPSFTYALRRLALLSEQLGDVNMAAHTEGMQGFNYQPGMFLRTRPGVIERVKPNGEPLQSPAGKSVPYSVPQADQAVEPSAAESQAEAN